MYIINVLSNCCDIEVGVPQGSVLGPLLFLVYVNDIHNAVPDVSFRLFADDTNAFVHDANCNNLIEKAQSVLSKLRTWFDANKLTLHLGKTNFSIFHATAMDDHVCPDHFNLSNTEIHRTSYTKYLGLLIDDRLAFKNHIDELCNSLAKYAGIFYRLRTTIPVSLSLQVYHTLVHSRISYGIVVYGTAPMSNMKPLQTIQNRILKTLSFKNRRYATNALHADLELLKVADLHLYKMGIFIHKYVNGSLPDIFNSIINPRNHSLTRINTRGGSLFSVTIHIGTNMESCS